jgi:hypothetical protein|tara:strand:+ start:40 stop:684 length:645 start_codon:yes stop_codon:yes gene_type:complete
MATVKFIADINDPLVKKEIEANYQPSFLVENLFTEQDLNTMWHMAFIDSKPKLTGNQSIVTINRPMDIVYQAMKDKFDFLPGAELSPTVGGNFFISSCEYSVHTDSTMETNVGDSTLEWLPWRNVLIPLWHNNNAGTFTTYKNRYADYAMTDTKYSVYNRSVFENLEVENTWDWKPGNAFVFDTMQAHRSNMPTENQYTLKGGLFLKFLRRRTK